MARARSVGAAEQHESVDPKKVLQDFQQNTIMVLMPRDLYRRVIEEAARREISPDVLLENALKHYVSLG
jgi:hypothetical protein